MDETQPFTIAERWHSDRMGCLSLVKMALDPEAPLSVSARVAWFRAALQKFSSQVAPGFDGASLLESVARSGQQKESRRKTRPR